MVDNVSVAVGDMNWCAESSPPYRLTNLVALVVVQGIADGTSAVGVLFVASNLIRQLKRLCHGAATVIDNRHMSISSPTRNRPQVVAGSGL